MGSKPLPFGAERVPILAIWTAVNPQQEGNFGPGYVAGRLGQKAMHFGPVLGRKTHLFGLTEVQLRNQFIVLMSDLPERIVFEGVYLVVFGIPTRNRHRTIAC